MIVELGHLALCLALLTSLMQALVPVASHYAKPHSLLFLTKPLATVTFMLMTAVFAVLINAYVTDDFSVYNVAANSNTQMPFVFKFAAAWGNHEGSMILWAWILSLYGFLMAFLRAADAELRAYTLAILGMLATGFIAFILFTSDPFIRIWPPVPEGNDLNPLLQDIGLTFHPPMLYMGYVGFAAVFAYAIAALWLNKVNSAFASIIRPWLMLPWSTLTLGIGAGSWWAYRELGWGGWWFWDPVENVSLLPWLTGTALFHANMVLEKRGQLARWVVLLAILTFTLSLVGTFIVRSGLITSVHAFASDPLRGMFILIYIAIVCGAALLVYALKEISPSAPVALLSRGGLIVLGNVILASAAGVVLVAILYPILLQLIGAPAVSVGPPYFNRSFLPLVAPLPFMAAIAPLIAWDHGGGEHCKRVMRQLWPAAAFGVVVALAFLLPNVLLGGIGCALGLWLLYGVYFYWRRVKASLSMRHVASIMGHAALAVFVLGITVTGLTKQTYEAPILPKKDIVFDQFTLRLVEAVKREEHNYTSRQARFKLSQNGRELTELTPELRFYPSRETQTTEAALFSSPLRDIYLVLGETAYGGEMNNALGVRMYVTPAQQWVWLGFLLAGLSGLLSLISALRKERT